MFSSSLASTLFALSLGALQALAYDNSRSDNVAVYWGQNSYGATHSDTANGQKTLSFYCQDGAIDALPIAFVSTFFSTGGEPTLDLSNICSPSSDPVYSGTSLPDCSFLASDIQTCQSKGKIVTISLGGASAGTGFTSAAQASAFGDTIWNLFLGGSSSTRPFGSAVLDGVDLDIEAGTTQYFDSFVNRLRTHANGASKKYYITGAPQCPYPDAHMTSVLNAVGFDAVYVQFYNNNCGLTDYSTAQWDFGSWDTWAKTVSPNKNVKVYIGAPASSTAAGSGYVDAGTLANIALATRSKYSSFGGVMLWDASQAYQNNRYDLAIKNAIKQGGSTTTTPPKTTTTTTTKATTTTKPASGGSCAGVPAWSSSVAYTGGQQVTYNGHLWTAKWWSEADVPGGPAGDWTDDGACSSFAAAAATPTQRSVTIVKDPRAWATVTASA